MRIEFPNDVAEVLDTRGLFCPIPIVKTSECLKHRVTGEAVMVLSDDPGIKEDMPAWCQANGHILEKQREQDGIISMIVRKKGRKQHTA